MNTNTTFSGIEITDIKRGSGQVTVHYCQTFDGGLRRDGFGTEIITLDYGYTDDEMSSAVDAWVAAENARLEANHE